MLSCGSLFATVGEIDIAPPLEESKIRAHDQVVRRLAGSVDAILPARFGSVIRDENALTSLLENRGVALRKALALVQGREQMTLRVYGERSPATTAESEHVTLGPGSRYLAEKMQGRERVLAELEAVRPQLAPLIKAERIQHHSTPPLLASIYHLVERGRSTDYFAALNTAASDVPKASRITASGPWPPYAFARWEEL